MSLMHRIKPAAPVKTAPAQKEKAPTVTSGKKRGPKPSGDPSVVLTLRVPKSVADGLKPGWRKRVADMLAKEAV